MVSVDKQVRGRVCLARAFVFFFPEQARVNVNRNEFFFRSRDANEHKGDGKKESE